MNEPPNGIPWRVASLERRMDRLDDLRLEAQIERIDQLHEDMKRLRTALLTFGFSILAAAIIFALAVFRVMGAG